MAESDASCRLHYPPHHPCVMAPGVWVAVRAICTASELTSSVHWAVQGNIATFWDTRAYWRDHRVAPGLQPLQRIMCRPLVARWGHFRGKWACPVCSLKCMYWFLLLSHIWNYWTDFDEIWYWWVDTKTFRIHKLKKRKKQRKKVKLSL
jgi:hypothetical protein